MPLYDLPLAELERYDPALPAPPDLAAFWARTIEESRGAGAPLAAEVVATGLPLVETRDVTFSGFGGDPIRAWYHRPAGAEGPLPVVVRYQGYGGGRGLAHEVPLWTLAGYASLVMDTRGQGSEHTGGDTVDPAGSGPAHPGYLTRGIDAPATFYYRRVFTDAVLAVDAARAMPGADPGRVIVAGGSQGGGMALAVAALRDDVAAAMVDVPFLAHLRRASEIAPAAPYSELRRYLAVHRGAVEDVFATLAHFDVAVLARNATAPALFSVALMDEVCPPSTVFAAYNAYAGPKEIAVYPYNGHEGGETVHEARQLAWLRATLGAG